MSKPSVPKPPPPPQEPKPAESMADRRRRRPMGSPTMLTGPAGVSAGALSTGAPSLLGS